MIKNNEESAMERNETNRELALSWWGSLSFDEQWVWSKRVFPTWKFSMVSASSSMIERIYNRYKIENGFRNEN
jgi:hypothetical protein